MNAPKFGLSAVVLCLIRYQLLWWLLWIGTVVFLSVMPSLSDGVRGNIPYGQYIFFTMTFVSSVVIVLAMNQKRVFFKARYQYWLFLIVVFLAMMPSALNGSSPLYSLRLLAIIFVTTIPFVLLGLISSQKRMLIPVFVVSVFCAFGTLFLQWFGPLNIGSVGFFNYLHGERWSFLFNEANDLGWMTTVGIVSGFYFLLAFRSAPGKLLLVSVLLVVLSLVFFMTNSRASFFWVLWACLVFFFTILYMVYEYYEKPKIFWKIVALLGVCTLFFLYIFLSDELYAFLRLHQGDVTSGRMPIWQLYWAQIKEHPWFGIGFGVTAEFLKDELVKTPLNVIVGVLGEGGIVGAIPFFLLWLSGVVIVIRVIIAEWSISKDRVFLAVWVLMMLGGIALQQMGEWSLMRVSPLHYLFFFALSVAWRLRKTKESGLNFPGRFE